MNPLLRQKIEEKDGEFQIVAMTIPRPYFDALGRLCQTYICHAICEKAPSRDALREKMLAEQSVTLKTMAAIDREFDLLYPTGSVYG